MKTILKALVVVLGIFGAIMDLLDLLVLPASFVLIGILSHLPLAYYLITVGGYFVFLLIIEVLSRMIFKKLEKKYSSRWGKKIDRIISRFSCCSEKNDTLPFEDN